MPAIGFTAPLHTVDRKLGVIVGDSGGATQFTLLTSEPTDRAAAQLTA
jgi:hypothetical protein